MWAKWKFGPHILLHMEGPLHVCGQNFNLACMAAKTNCFFFNHRVVTLVAVKLERWWYMRDLLLVLETNCTRRPER